MIRGYLAGSAGRLRPFVEASVVISSLAITDTVEFLIDTGADSTVLGPRDALRLGLDLRRLAAGPFTTGAGGQTHTVRVDAVLTLDGHRFSLTPRILAPRTPRQQEALARVPSLLGRDVLTDFGLFLELRTSRVLLLDSQEAAALTLPAR